jgi:hypothetical protein
VEKNRKEMKRYFLSCWLYFPCILSGFGQQAALVHKCQNGEYIRSNELHLLRIPNVQFFSRSNFPLYPVECITSINKDLTDQLKKFESDDKANWLQLANQHCSYNQGWVEYTPGQCNAGGPPPICPVNHWYQNKAKAAQVAKELAEKLISQRAQEIASLKKSLEKKACNCWANKIEQDGEVIHQQQQQLTSEVKINVAVIKQPCIGLIPPGFKCENGVLVAEDKVQQKLIDKAAETAVKNTELYKDLIESLKESINLFRKYYKILNNPATKSVFFMIELYDSPWLNDNWGNYSKQIDKMNLTLNKLELAGQELSRFRRNANPCLCRDEKLIIKDLESIKSTLFNQVSVFNQLAQAIEREESCNTCCKQGYTVITKKINQSIYDIIGSLN